MNWFSDHLLWGCHQKKLVDWTLFVKLRQHPDGIQVNKSTCCSFPQRTHPCVRRQSSNSQGRQTTLSFFCASFWEKSLTLAIKTSPATMQLCNIWLLSTTQTSPASPVSDTCCFCVHGNHGDGHLDMHSLHQNTDCFWFFFNSFISAHPLHPCKVWVWPCKIEALCMFCDNTAWTMSLTLDTLQCQLWSNSHQFFEGNHLFFLQPVSCFLWFVMLLHTKWWWQQHKCASWNILHSCIPFCFKQFPLLSALSLVAWCLHATHLLGDWQFAVQLTWKTFDPLLSTHDQCSSCQKEIHEMLLVQFIELTLACLLLDKWMSHVLCFFLFSTTLRVSNCLGNWHNSIGDGMLLASSWMTCGQEFPCAPVGSGG